LKIDELTKQLEEKDKLLQEKETEIASLTNQNAELSEYKSSVEAEKERVARLASIKTKFDEAGLNKNEDYFTEKADKLLSMSDDEFDFMLQELVSFSKKSNASVNEDDGTDIPNITASGGSKLTPKEIGTELRNIKF